MEKKIALPSKDKSLSATVLAGQIGISAKDEEKQIAKLKSEGILKRIGPGKGGYWQVIVTESCFSMKVPVGIYYPSSVPCFGIVTIYRRKMLISRRR